MYLPPAPPRTSQCPSNRVQPGSKSHGASLSVTHDDDGRANPRTPSTNRLSDFPRLFSLPKLHFEYNQYPTPKTVFFNLASRQPDWQRPIAPDMSSKSVAGTGTTSTPSGDRSARRSGPTPDHPTTEKSLLGVERLRRWSCTDRNCFQTSSAMPTGWGWRQFPRMSECCRASVTLTGSLGQPASDHSEACCRRRTRTPRARRPCSPTVC